MNISKPSITKLQVLLQTQHGVEYDTEKAQQAGRAVLRLAGIKLYQQFEKEKNHESNT